jgi:hypothetical protein
VHKHCDAMLPPWSTALSRVRDHQVAAVARREVGFEQCAVVGCVEHSTSTTGAPLRCATPKCSSVVSTAARTQTVPVAVRGRPSGPLRSSTKCGYTTLHYSTWNSVSYRMETAQQRATIPITHEETQRGWRKRDGRCLMRVVRPQPKTAERLEDGAFRVSGDIGCQYEAWKGIFS